MKPRYWSVELTGHEDDQKPISVAKIFIVETQADAVDQDLKDGTSLLRRFCQTKGITVEDVLTDKEHALTVLAGEIAVTAAATHGWTSRHPIGINPSQSLPPIHEAQEPTIRDSHYRAWLSTCREG